MLAQAAGQGVLPAGELTPVRALYRMVCEAVAEVTSRELTWTNFRQILAGFEHDHGEITGLERVLAGTDRFLSRRAAPGG